MEEIFAYFLTSDIEKGESSSTLVTFLSITICFAQLTKGQMGNELHRAQQLETGGMETKCIEHYYHPMKIKTNCGANNACMHACFHQFYYCP